MAVLRRTRILVTAILLLIIFFSTRQYDAFPKAPAWPNDVPSAADVSNPVDADEAVVLEQTGYDPVDPVLVEDAHKLSFADAFLPHFQAVTRLPGMSVTDAKSTCTWPDDVTVNFQYGLDRDWATKDREFSELEDRRKQWHSFIDRDMVPYATVKDKFSGRGLVIVAGNQDTLMRVRVILRALIKLGSKIPVEINYWDDEMDDKTKAGLLEMYPSMYFNDLASPSNVLRIHKSGIYINYQLKTAAVVNSRFAEPILLDSDNIPVVDPASLYDTPEYKEYGTIFWPDIARTRPQNPIWALTNTPCAMDEYEQESGQLVVDKTRFFYHLQLAAWFNNNQGDYYNEFILGDKDTFRFAWHALKTKYGRPRRWVASVGTTNDGFYCGHTFAQHHPNGSVAFLHGGLLKVTDLEVIAWNRDTRGGIFREYKRAPADKDPSVSVDVGIKWDTAEYLPDHSAEFHGGSCTDMFDVEPRDMNELVPGFEKLFEELGGYWMVDEWKEKNKGETESGNVQAGNEAPQQDVVDTKMDLLPPADTEGQMGT